jgi:methionyl-tRNA formyltransferase
MNEIMDDGEIILQKKINIEASDTAVTLENKLADAGAQLLLASLDKIEEKNFQLQPQDKNRVTFAPKLKKKDGLINWQAQALAIHNLVRGCCDWPGAFTYYKDKLLKVFKTQVLPQAASQAVFCPGEIISVSKDGITVASAGDNLLIQDLQIEGKRRMSAAEFIAGHKIILGDRLGYPAPRNQI